MLTLEEKQIVRSAADSIVAAPYTTKVFFGHIDSGHVLSKYAQSVLDVLFGYCDNTMSDTYYKDYVGKLKLATEEIEDEDVKTIFETSIDYYDYMMRSV